MKDLDQRVQNFLTEREELLEQYVKRMDTDYNIKEVTTKRQLANGTRRFRMPNNDIIASYKSGYVRRCGRLRLYQINKTYKQERRYTVLSGDSLKTIKVISTARELIYDPMVRMLYIVEFGKRNCGVA